MGRKCSICTHKDHEAIDRALLDSESISTIAERFGVSKSALSRHSNSHLPETIAVAVAEVVNMSPEIRERELRTAEALLEDIRISNEKLDRWEGILEKLLEAAEEFIGAPFSADKDRAGRARLLFSGKALIQTLAELRKLLAGRHRFLELEARVLKLVSGDEITVNILGSPEWMEIQETIAEAVEPYPEARAAIFRALQERQEREL